ncbi:MAG: PD-(D/E)XK nuclease family protein [Helicobacter sp.]|nr:PD-(D/E)XK nuclease family protein [Helicobacter sp.]
MIIAQKAFQKALMFKAIKDTKANIKDYELLLKIYGQSDLDNLGDLAALGSFGELDAIFKAYAKIKSFVPEQNLQTKLQEKEKEGTQEQGKEDAQTQLRGAGRAKIISFNLQDRLDQIAFINETKGKIGAIFLPKISRLAFMKLFNALKCDFIDGFVLGVFHLASLFSTKIYGNRSEFLAGASNDLIDFLEAQNRFDLKVFRKDLANFNAQFLELDFLELEDFAEFYMKELSLLKLPTKIMPIESGEGVVECKIPVLNIEDFDFKMDFGDFEKGEIVIADFNESALFSYEYEQIPANIRARSALKIPSRSKNKEQILEKIYGLFNSAPFNGVFGINILHIDNGDFIIDYLKERFVIEEGNFDKNIFDFSAKLHYKEEEIICPLPEDYVFSYSSLKDLLECKRKFYLKRILRIKEPQNIKSLSGEILHIILKNAYQKGSSIDCIRSNFEAALENYIFESNTQRFETKLLLAKIGDFWRIEKERFREYSFSEAEYEFEVNIFGKNFKGVIDRIDKNKDAKCAILDYKFYKSFDPRRILQVSQDLAKNDFQLVIYRKALETQGFDVKEASIVDMKNAIFYKEHNHEQKLDLLSSFFANLGGIINFEKCNKCTYCKEF